MHGSGDRRAGRQYAEQSTQRAFERFMQAAPISAQRAATDVVWVNGNQRDIGGRRNEREVVDDRSEPSRQTSMT